MNLLAGEVGQGRISGFRCKDKLILKKGEIPIATVLKEKSNGGKDSENLPLTYTFLFFFICTRDFSDLLRIRS